MHVCVLYRVENKAEQLCSYVAEKEGRGGRVGGTEGWGQREGGGSESD